MKHIGSLLLAFGIFFTGCVTAPKKDPTVKKLAPGVVWQVTEGVQAPESAYLDKASGFLFVSQIGSGGGMGKDGDGWPSMGAVAAKFRGANAPGMPPFVGLADSWVADVWSHPGCQY